MTTPARPTRKATRLVLGSRGNTGSSNTDTAEIEITGALRLEASDVGPQTEALWGRDEHQFIVTVAADWKDTVLITLLHDRFSTVGEAATWLAERGIPFTQSRWT